MPRVALQKRCKHSAWPVSVMLAGFAVGSLAGPASAQVINLRAQDYIRGCNVAVAAGPVLQYGSGVLLNAPPFPEINNCAEYRVVVPSAGLYRLEIEYAALHSRPVSVLINGSRVATGAISEVTGCWYVECQRWSVVGDFALNAGENSLLLDRDAVFPHIRALRLTRVGASAVPSDLPSGADATAVPPVGRIGRLTAEILERVTSAGAAQPGGRPAQTKGDLTVQGATPRHVGTGGAWVLRDSRTNDVVALLVWGGPFGNMGMTTEGGTMFIDYDMPRRDSRLPDGGLSIDVLESVGEPLIGLDLPATQSERMAITLRYPDGDRSPAIMERTACDMRFAETDDTAVPGCVWRAASSFLIQDAWLSGDCAYGLACNFLIPRELAP